MRLLATLTTTLLLCTGSLYAKQWVKTYSDAAFIGPEIYYMERTKEGGAKQTGVLYGARIGYDRIQRCKLYWGADALWAQGILNGKKEDFRLRSQFTDANIEARFGYTFQCKSWRCASFTPFVGFGYFMEKNDYKHPTPLQVHFDNRFSYAPVGFLSEIFITPTFTLGLNFKVRVIMEGWQTVTHDPEHGRMTQHYDEKLQYRVELPLTYFFNWGCAALATSLDPFYEYRKYGHRANFPFDFFETQYQLYGATLKLFYLF